ncbi:Ig-like domain-containing protein, partial [Methanobrevibacter sp.]|uniref:Ig-like domain-containing protein n=1 Tax=Methanobrevibacter sp. TaxID=66852 RepID=UPI00388D1126
MNKKIVFFICLIAIILSAACVSAAEDVAQTNIGDTSNLDANGDILAISSSENEILGADEPGTFTELQAMVNSGNATINLTKDFQWDATFEDYAIKINNPITINGNGHTIDALNRNDLRIFEINNVNSGIILDNITFKNGNTASHGGAINIISALSDSKFTNLNFINNTAKFNGGAVRFYRASENNLFENIIFIDNIGIDGNGGALYMTETSTSDTFKNIMFANNVATSNTGKRRDGGAINFHDKVDGATFDNVLFSNNRAEKSVGGAINIDDGIKNSIFNNTYFIDNSAKTGGAIGITGTISSLTFENTKFINNTALVDDGGAINIGPWGHSDLANTTFKNVLFENNTAAKEGGAIYVTANTLSNTFENVEFINNAAGTNAEADRADGGAIKFGANSGYTTEKNTFKNVNFTNNTAKENGGALYVTGKSTSNTFEDINFINNIAKTQDGGAINFLGKVSSATFDNVLFHNNRAEVNAGGAINIDNGIENSIFNNTYFIDNSAMTGGAIGITKTISSLTFENTQFINNTALEHDGGAINIGPHAHSDLADTTFKNVLFENNTANNNGGALFVTKETRSNTFENVEFINNVAKTADGGAVRFGALNWEYITQGNTFKNVNFTNNTAKENGGALYVTGKSSSNTFENVDFINNVAKTVDGGAINFYKLADDTTFEEVLFYKNSAPGCGGGALNFDNGMENTRFTNTLFVENSALYTSAMAITGNTSSNTIESSVFYNNTATNYLIYFGNPISDNIIRDSIIVDNDARSIITKEGGLIELTDNWFGNNATNYDENPDVFYVMDNWLFLNATANPAAITLNQKSTVTFKFSSFKDGSGVEEYDGPVYIFLQLSSTLGTLNRAVALTDDEIVYTPSESGNGSVTGTFLNKYYTVNIENDKIPTEISVENSTLDMLVLDNVPAGANLTPADAGYLSYNSSNSSVAVAIYGRIIAVGEGSAIITVSFDGDDTYAAAENKTIEVTVSKRPTEITLLNDTLNVTVLEFIPDVATLDPAEAGNLSYTSSNSSIVQIYNDSIIPVGEGSAIITVSFDGDEIYAAAENRTITVNVRLNDASVSVDNDTLDLFVEDTYAINATTVPDFLKDYFINYSSSNEDVATVDETGTVTAVGEGTAIITVEVGDGKIFAINSTTVTVTVSRIPTEITVANTTLDMAPLDFSAINATLTPDVGDLTYNSTDSSVASVLFGYIIAVGEGKANITVYFEGDNKYAASEKVIEVTVTKIPTEITVENTTIEMNPFDVAPVGANLTPGLDFTLTYTSSNSSVATVILGEIVALSEGEATITVSFDGTIRYAAAENKTIDVIVTKIPTEITVEKTTIEMAPLDITPTGANLTNASNLLLTYTSSNSSVATVILGEIVALSEGEATITVSFNGTTRYAAAKNKTIDVIVTKIPTEITVESTAIEMVPLDIAPTGANLTNASNLLLTYTSSNSSVATVILGEIIAVSEGEATITVSFNGTTRYAAAENKTIEVTVKKIPTEITIENATIEMAPLDIAPTGANLTNNASNLYLDYVSSNSSVAIVVLGEIIAVGEGEATITVSFNGTARYAAAENKTINVIVNKIPTEITVENTTIDMKVLDVVPAGANLTPGLDLTLTYTSSNSSVAVVILGEIVAVGEGSATITVSFDGDIRHAAAENKTITVNVSLRDASVSVDNDTLDLIVEDTYSIDATTDPAFLKYLTLNYSSSDESVATVDENGTVTAVGQGTAIITVTVGDGKVYVINSTNVTVTVSKIQYEPDVTLDDKTLTVEVPENATGDITLLIGEETIVAPIEDGIATFDLSDVPPGDYNASIMYGGDKIYEGFEIEYPISIEDDFILTADDVTKYYG